MPIHVNSLVQTTMSVHQTVSFIPVFSLKTQLSSASQIPEVYGGGLLTGLWLKLDGVQT